MNTLIGKRVRIADGRFGVIENVTFVYDKKFNMTSTRIHVRVGGDLFDLSAKNVELVSA